MRHTIALLVLFLCTNVFSQQVGTLTGPSPGDSVPDIAFNNIFNYPGGEASLSDFGDKLIILDFWATWCGPCIKSVTKLHELQERLGNRIQIITITTQKAEVVRAFFTKKGWTLPAVVEDTVLIKMFPHKAIPHQVWIKDMVVKAIPTYYYTTAENIEAALQGDRVKMQRKKDKVIDRKKPLLSSDTGIETLYYSAITKSYSNSSSGRSLDNNVLLAYNQSMVDLYVTAYKLPYVPYHSRVIYEVNDSLRALIAGPGYPKSGDSNEKLNAYYEWQADNTYCYNLMFNDEELFENKKNVSQDMYAIMRQDLTRFFSLHVGVVGSLEKRTIKCLALVKTKKGSKRNQEQEYSEDNNDNNYVLKNKSIMSFVSALGLKHYKALGIPIVDATGIAGKINLEIKGGIDDLENVKKELQRYGLDLEQRRYQMNMVVFREVKDP